MEWTWIEIRQIIQKIVTVKIFSKLKKKATKVTLILNSLYYHFLRKNSTCSINTSKHNSWKEMKIFAHVNPPSPNITTYKIPKTDLHTKFEELVGRI